VRIVKMILQVNLGNVVRESNAYLFEDYREKSIVGAFYEHELIPTCILWRI